jgi:hypothetical protein
MRRPERAASLRIHPDTSSPGPPRSLAATSTRPSTGTACARVSASPWPETSRDVTTCLPSSRGKPRRRIAAGKAVSCRLRWSGSWQRAARPTTGCFRGAWPCRSARGRRTTELASCAPTSAIRSARTSPPRVRTACWTCTARQGSGSTTASSRSLIVSTSRGVTRPRQITSGPSISNVPGSHGTFTSACTRRRARAASTW